MVPVLAKALAAMHKRGERWWEAEIHRLRGELLLRQASVSGGSRDAPPEKLLSAVADGDVTRQLPLTSEAEACLHQALDIIRHQGAKSLELRAAMSLSRLWQRQGRREEARQLLAEVYGWFTEGFDTADLQEARALLDELSSGFRVPPGSSAHGKEFTLSWMVLFMFFLRQLSLGPGRSESHLHGAVQVNDSRQLAMSLLLPSDLGLQLERMCFRKVAAMKLFGTVSPHVLTSKPKGTILLRLV